MRGEEGTYEAENEDAHLFLRENEAGEPGHRVSHLVRCSRPRRVPFLSLKPPSSSLFRGFSDGFVNACAGQSLEKMVGVSRWYWGMRWKKRRCVVEGKVV